MKTIKKIATTLMVLIIASSVFSQTPPEPFPSDPTKDDSKPVGQYYSGGGSGTSGDPYKIATLADLKYLSEHSEHWNKYFIQTDDIDASATSTWNGGDGFSPIGNSSTYFTGSYDGSDENGSYTIDNLFINRPSTSYIGLFGFTNGATIQNVGITSADVTGDNTVGVLAGRVLNSTVTNTYATGSVNGSSYYLGGLVGSNYGTVSDSYATSDVTGSSDNANYVGGLIGENRGTVSNSYASGSVDGPDYVGGLVGINWDMVSNSYATGSVNGSTVRVGGLVGYNGSTVTISYATGEVTSEGDAGGLVGYNGGDVTSSFWDTETSGQESSDGGTGKTTAEMTNYNTFLDNGWDFIDETENGTDNVWGINPAENNGYPFLSWQGYTHAPISAPSQQASDIAFSDVGTTSMTVRWIRGDGDSCAVFATQADTGAALSANDTFYSADSVFQNGDQIGTSGWYAVYRGTDTLVTVTGLSIGTTYRFHVCEFNTGSTFYNSDTSTNNPANQKTNSITATVTITSIDSIAETSASVGGNVTDDGGASVTARGVCWGRAENPTTDSSHTADGTGTGEFNSSLTDLSPNSPYHLRAYATNSVGTGYGADTSFCTLSVPPTTETVTCDSSGTTTLKFTAVGGFGPGRVDSYFGILFNIDREEKTTCNSGTENISGPSCSRCYINEYLWNSGELAVCIPEADSSYTFELIGLNADSVANGTLDFGPFRWDGTPISPVTSLDVNANGNSLNFSWTNPANDAHAVDVWLKGFGGYPQYTGSVPAFPSTPTEASENGWIKVSDSLLTSLTYTPASRDFYYAAIFVKDLAEHYSAAVIDSSLSYWLGDVNPTPDGEVNAADIAILASAYRTEVGENYFNPACDVGPTLNRGRTARPTPDSSINFEDLMVFAMNYENTGRNNAEKVLAKTTVKPITLNLNIQQNNTQFIAQIQLNGNQDIVKGLEIPISFGADLRVVSVKKGKLVTGGDFFHLNQTENTFFISTAALDENGVFEGDGVVAEVEFQVNGTDASLQFGNVIARSASNETIEVNYEYTDVELIAESLIPTEYKLHQNFPNPFNPSTTIQYDLKARGLVKITLYNINGQRIKTLIHEEKPAGYHVLELQADDLASGMYFYKIQVNEFSALKKMMLVK